MRPAMPMPMHRLAVWPPRSNPRIIRRSDNRVDFSGCSRFSKAGLSRFERIRLCPATGLFRTIACVVFLGTKQAGSFCGAVIQARLHLLRDRIEFDKQVLQGFLLLARVMWIPHHRCGIVSLRESRKWLLSSTFNVQEGQQFRFRRVTTSSDRVRIRQTLMNIRARALNIRDGASYSPMDRNNIARLATRLAIPEGLEFCSRLEPRSCARPANLTWMWNFAAACWPGFHRTH